MKNGGIVLEKFNRRKVIKTISFYILITLLYLLVHSQLSAQNYPSQTVVGLGYEKVGRLSDIIYPLWQRAYPAKNYSALFAAAPKMDSAMSDFYEMKFSSHYGSKIEAFKERRYNLLQSISDYKKAAEDNDSNAVYQLLPQIQAYFESTAAVLIPYPYPAFDKALTLVFHFADSLPKIDNPLTLAKATDSLTAAIRRISPDSAPTELKSKDITNLVPQELIYFDTLSVRMRTALEARDMTKFRRLAGELNARFHTFRRIYLE